MYQKILVANRGEIALRVIRACKEMGVASVGVYSEADADALHVKFADEVVCIGPAQSRQSYLNIPRIIGAAEISGADAIHPGYGFLAENAQFAEICAESDLDFIGPSADTIARMGNKSLARKTMSDAGVPVLPGSIAVLRDENEALAEAERIGFPIILKASAGGGGKGMRIVRKPEEISRLFTMARVEAQTAFNDGDIYIEKYLENPRHIEVQIMGYSDSTILTFGERDCSIQRRHQKLIEESPSPAVSPELRRALSEAAVAGAKAVNYVGAGTFEFLYEKGEFYFMEMNARIQVEHPVSEMVNQFDLVKEQILSCSGQAPPSTQNFIPKGHAIECRINAENPAKGFVPCPGKITSFHVPGGMGVRVDTHAYAGYVIPPYYDSLIAKLITFGNSRDEALRRMDRALCEFIVEGIETTISLHQTLINDPKFIEGDYDTTFIENRKIIK